MNLLNETEDYINYLGYEPCDIIFIGSEKRGLSCTWNEFAVLADREYDAGYGAQEVMADLVIVFRDGAYMWRSEYDGSEAWNCDKPFSLPVETKPLTNLFGG